MSNVVYVSCEEVALFANTEIHLPPLPSLSMSPPYFCFAYILLLFLCRIHAYNVANDEKFGAIAHHGT